MEFGINLLKLRGRFGNGEKEFGLNPSKMGRLKKKRFEKTPIRAVFWVFLFFFFSPLSLDFRSFLPLKSSPHSPCWSPGIPRSRLEFPAGFPAGDWGASGWIPVGRGAALAGEREGEGQGGHGAPGAPSADPAPGNPEGTKGTRRSEAESAFSRAEPRSCEEEPAVLRGNPAV